jgi:hypothetical protein
MDALAKARKRLSSRLADPKVKFMPGLADDLRAIDDAFEHIERSLANLAAFALRKHFWPMSQVHPGQLKALTELGTDPATVARVAQHGGICTCSECMGAG